MLVYIPLYLYVYVFNCLLIYRNLWAERREKVQGLNAHFGDFVLEQFPPKAAREELLCFLRHQRLLSACHAWAGWVCSSRFWR